VASKFHKVTTVVVVVMVTFSKVLLIKHYLAVDPEDPLADTSYWWWKDDIKPWVRCHTIPNFRPTRNHKVT